MADKTNTNSGQPPAPEELKPQSASHSNVPPAEKEQDGDPKAPKPKRRGSYRPSHKATFIALVVVILILVINGGVIGFVLKRQSSLKQKVNSAAVTISQSALAKLGVNQTPVKDQGLKLTVNPNAQFNGNVQIAGDTSIGGQLTLNNKFNANSASFANLQAGNTALTGLNVNGDGTISDLTLRKNLTVAGASQLQGQVTVASMLTAANENVTGDLSVGGTLSVRSFHADSITSDSTLTIGGHVITGGPAPGVSGGNCGGVTNSGDDAAGTIFIPIGAGGCSGTIASLRFDTPYSNIPQVVITPVAVPGGTVPSGVTFYVSSISASGFSIAVSPTLGAGGIEVSYIVEQ